MTISEVTVRFDDDTVLDRLSLSFEKNGLFLIKAPSGFGKTTLFRAIAGLVPLAEGYIAEQGRVAYAFQEPRLLPWLSAWENVFIVDENKSADEAKRWLTTFGFHEREMQRTAAQLSGGMRQRVNLARAFYFNGDTVLLDEPLTGLDEGNREILLQTVLEEKKRRCILVVLHDDVWDDYADQTVKLDENVVKTVNDEYKK